MLASSHLPRILISFLQQQHIYYMGYFSLEVEITSLT